MAGLGQLPGGAMEKGHENRKKGGKEDLEPWRAEKDGQDSGRGRKGLKGKKAGPDNRFDKPRPSFPCKNRARRFDKPLLFPNEAISFVSFLAFPGIFFSEREPFLFSRSFFSLLRLDLETRISASLPMSSLFLTPSFFADAPIAPG